LKVVLLSSSIAPSVIDFAPNSATLSVVSKVCLTVLPSGKVTSKVIGPSDKVLSLIGFLTVSPNEVNTFLAAGAVLSAANVAPAKIKS